MARRALRDQGLRTRQRARPSGRALLTYDGYALEREAEADLADALLGLLEVAGIRVRLHERGAGLVVDDRVCRVLRVQHVEQLTDRLDARVAEQAEALRDAQVELRAPRAAAAVPGLAVADFLR